MEKPTWKKKGTKTIYENKWIKLREDEVVQPDGEDSIYTFLEMGGFSVVIAEDGDGGVFLIEEYRYPIKKEVWQLPMGIIGKDESPIENAKKELKEEAGLTAESWEEIGEFYPCSGKINASVHVFLAKNLDTSNTGINQDGDESIWSLKKASIIEIKEMIKENKIKSGEALSALNIYLNLL